MVISAYFWLKDDNAVDAQDRESHRETHHLDTLTNTNTGNLPVFCSPCRFCTIRRTPARPCSCINASRLNISPFKTLHSDTRYERVSA